MMIGINEQQEKESGHQRRPEKEGIEYALHIFSG